MLLSIFILVLLFLVFLWLSVVLGNVGGVKKFLLKDFEKVEIFILCISRPFVRITFSFLLSSFFTAESSVMFLSLPRSGCSGSNFPKNSSPWMRDFWSFEVFVLSSMSFFTTCLRSFCKETSGKSNLCYKCCSIVCTAISFAPLPFECLFSASNLSNSFMAAFRLLSSSARCHQIYKWSILFKGIDHVGCPPLYEIGYEPEDLFRRHPVLHHRRCDRAQVAPETRNEHFYHLGFQLMFCVV